MHAAALKTGDRSKAQPKKKSRYDKTNLVITKSNHTRWWFVLRGDEDILSTLESEWEQVQLQTNWKLEPLLKFSDNDELVDSVIHAEEDHSNPNSNSESFLTNS